MKYTHEIVGTHRGALLPERAPGACSGSKTPLVYRPLRHRGRNCFRVIPHLFAPSMNSNAWRFTWPDRENAVFLNIYFSSFCREMKSIQLERKPIYWLQEPLIAFVLVPLTLTNMLIATHYEFTRIHIFKNFLNNVNWY